MKGSWGSTQERGITYLTLFVPWRDLNKLKKQKIILSVSEVEAREFDSILDVNLIDEVKGP